MNHSFNVEIATKYGMLEAILLEHLNFWISKNKANEVNFYDGNYWTYNSTKALAQLFPYVSLNTISRALRHLKEEGLILVGNYNKISYDRTTWYAITEKGNSILQNDEMDSPKMENGFTQNDEMDSLKMTNGFTQIDKPIPDINPDINTNINISDITPDINIPDINTDINPDDIVTVSNETVCQTDVRLVVEAWNKLQDYGINPVSKISNTSKRCHSLVARIRQYGITEVLSAIERIKLSDFLQGKNNKGWVITFDWFVLPNNFPKVLEGNYDNGQRQKTPYQSQTEQMLENSYSMMSEWAKNKKMQEGFNDN